MVSEIPTLVAFERTDTGKNAMRRARRNGQIPGVVYGDGAPLSIAIYQNELLRSLKAGRFMSTLFNLQVENHKDVRVICRAVQRDIVKGLPLHFDLMRLRRTSRINLFIPVEFINEDQAPGIKRGGVLTVVRPEVELLVTAGDIPQKITFDLVGLNVGDIITISHANLPKGVKPVIDRDFVIANISAPSGLRSADNEEGDPTADSESDSD